jgi:hypothetical protein
MLDGNTHESGGPELELSSPAPRLLNAAALLEGLAALEAEFATVLSPSGRQALESRGES